MQDIEQLTGVTTAVAHQGLGLGEAYVEFAEFLVGSDGAIEEFHEVVLLQGLKDVELATGEQRADDLKGGILRRSTDEGHDTSLHSTEQGVLLRLGETVYLVDEENGGSL